MAQQQNILNLEHIDKSFNSRMLLKDASMGMMSTDKIGVIGINGAGKSTLLAIAAGVLEPDSGHVTRTGNLRISYLSQNPVFDPDLTLLENVADRVSGKADHWDTTGEVRATLAKFGIDDADADVSTLSGGQKKRAALVAAILTPSDLLILDEPTNHLDNQMAGWLEDFLKAYEGAILMVTHDRYFLDSVSNTIVEIDRGSLYRYEDANYSRYLELKAERTDFARAAERKAAALYRQDLAWMLRGARARSTKQKAHIQRFEALRDRDKIVEDRNVELNSLASRLGGKTIEVNGISKSYGDRTLFSDFSYIFLKTDRIGIIGPNGCGKSTLLKCITGLEKPDAGAVDIGQTVRIGFFRQENEELDASKRVIDDIRDTAEYIRTSDGLTSASAMCEKFLFDSEMQYAPIGKLSGGEKRRLYLLKVLMSAPNVLILDEPTNDLDIQTLRILEDYLDHFAGIVITVSHDRYFLDRVVNRIFSFEPDGTIRQSEGGYEEYLEHRDSYGTSPEDAKNVPRAGGRIGGRIASGGEGDSSAKEDWLRQKEEQKKKNQAKLSYKEKREWETIEDEIAALEEKSRSLEAAMVEAATDFVKLADLQKQKEETDAALDARMERYFELSEKVE
ncbi:MAG: ABC-F family ATP-binding cassette domain-containing protein [Lachnospiraceae bacterium]|nr:ABC-F family ATP-binding cassette domain-containing protein [Lachnospiraceae bacterium]